MENLGKIQDCSKNCMKGDRPERKVICLDGPPFRCSVCQATYSSRFNLKKHLKNYHDFQELVNTGSLHCPGCRYSFATHKDLANHITNAHDIQQVIVKLSFFSEDDFARWKAEEESKSSAYFVCKKTNHYDTFKITYYYCNRSGSYNSKAAYRKPKRGHTIKIGKACPATITKKCETHDGLTEITVCYQSTHFGHTLQQGRHRGGGGGPNSNLKTTAENKHGGGGDGGHIQDVVEEQRTVILDTLESLTDLAMSVTSLSQLAAFKILLEPIRSTILAIEQQEENEELNTVPVPVECQVELHELDDGSPNLSHDGERSDVATTEPKSMISLPDDDDDDDEDDDDDVALNLVKSETMYRKA